MSHICQKKHVDLGIPHNRDCYPAQLSRQDATLQEGAWEVQETIDIEAELQAISFQEWLHDEATDCVEKTHIQAYHDEKKNTESDKSEKV